MLKKTFFVLGIMLFITLHTFTACEENSVPYNEQEFVISLSNSMLTRNDMINGKILVWYEALDAVSHSIDCNLGTAANVINSLKSDQLSVFETGNGQIKYMHIWRKR